MKIIWMEKMSKSANRSSHRGKNISQRTDYQKYIRATDSQPTVDDNIPFDTTLRHERESSEPTSKRKRPIPLEIQIRNYFKKNLIGWIIGVFICISIYFYVDARINIAVLDANLNNQKIQLDKISSTIDNNNIYQSQKNEGINSSIRSIEKDNNMQDLIINELKIRLDALDEKLKNNQP